MNRRQLFLVSVLCLLFCGLLSGCSGPDDLCVRNYYPFAILLRHKDGDLIGDVPARSTRTFPSAGGFKGDWIDGIRYENEKHQTIGTLRKNDPKVTSGGERLNGSVTWSVTVGPVGFLPLVDFDRSGLWWLGGGVFLLGLRLVKMRRTRR